MAASKAIIDGMAHRLWGVAYRRAFAQKLRRGVPGNMPVPEVPTVAKKAAADLAKLYESVNGGRSLTAVAREWIAAYDSANDDPTEERPDEGHFGFLAAGEAIGFVREALFESMLTVPTFEISLDGDTLTWTGHEETRNPKKPHEVPHVKTIAETRRILASVTPCSKGCPGWAVFETSRGDEIQVCDECMQSLKPAARLSDDDVAQLPEAKKALATHGDFEGNPCGRNPSKRFVVVMVNNDQSQTYAAEIHGDPTSSAAIDDALNRAVDMAQTDERDSIMYTMIDAPDAGAARVNQKLFRQQWKLYKMAGPITTNPRRRS